MSNNDIRLTKIAANGTVSGVVADKNPYHYNGQALAEQPITGKSINHKKVYIESYGCQMNFSDTEIVAAILAENGFTITAEINDADIILLNTCAIREKAEQTIYSRLTHINGLKKQKKNIYVGILGCMAERLKHKLLEEEKIIDLASGPDAYRQLPDLIRKIEKGHKAVNTFLSRKETYTDITPLRSHPERITAFISIMRGCDNMCSFCVVPFTRGRERSRDTHGIVKEATDLFQKGYREVTLLGQNVDSYMWSPEENNKARIAKKGITTTVNFAALLEKVAQVHPDLRVRFSTSNPGDMTDEVLYVMSKYENICKYIHLPVQSGNNRILDLMHRGYTREWYLEKIDRIRKILGREVGISSDIITGFCEETDAEHQDTLDLMDNVQFDFAYMFCYSERPGTVAAKKLQDNVPQSIKKARLQQIIHKQNQISLRRNRQSVGKIFSVLVEGSSKRSANHWQGRNSANKVIVFPCQNPCKGNYVNVLVKDCTSATLLGEIVD